MKIDKDTTAAEAIGMVHEDLCNKSTIFFKMMVKGVIIWFIVIPIIGAIFSFLGWIIFWLCMH